MAIHKHTAPHACECRLHKHARAVNAFVHHCCSHLHLAKVYISAHTHTRPPWGKAVTMQMVPHLCALTWTKALRLCISQGPTSPHGAWKTAPARSALHLTWHGTGAFLRLLSTAPGTSWRCFPPPYGLPAGSSQELDFCHCWWGHSAGARRALAG